MGKAAAEEQQHTQQLQQVLQAVAETAAATATAAVSGQAAEASAVASASATTAMQSAEQSTAPASEPHPAPAQKEPSATSAVSSSSSATPADVLSQASSSSAPPSSLKPQPLVASARTARRRSLVLLEQSGIFSGMGVAERRASALGLTAGMLGGTGSSHGSTGVTGPMRSPSASFAGGPMRMGSMSAGGPTAPRAPAHARRSTPAGAGLPDGSEVGGPQAAHRLPKRMGSATGSVSWLMGTGHSWGDGANVGDGGRAPSEASSDGTGAMVGGAGVGVGQQPGDLPGGPLAPVAESPDLDAEGGESGKSSFSGFRSDNQEQQAAAEPGVVPQVAAERQEGEPPQQQQQDECPDATTNGLVDGDSLASQETATQRTGPPGQALELQVPASPHPPPTECGSVLGPTLSGGVGAARQGPLGPPMTTSMVAAAKALTMLSELASLQVGAS